MIYSKVLVFIILFHGYAFSQELDLTLVKEETKKELVERINNLENKKLDEFVNQLTRIEIEFRDLFLSKNEECRGVFVYYLINSENKKTEKRKRLSRKERKECMKKLIQSKIEIQKVIFKVRSSHLLKLHRKQLEELTTSQDLLLKELLKESKNYQ